MRSVSKGWIARGGLLLAVIVGTLPAQAAPKLGAGAITNGIYSVCNSVSPMGRLTFDFIGRMPAGSHVYTVTGGRANGTWACESPTIPFAMRGTTPSGSFRWDCVGRIPVEVSVAGWPPIFGYEGRCKTRGMPGGFQLGLILQAIEDRDPSIAHSRYSFVGAYVAGSAG
jgi:hypothetical protein